MSGFLSPGSIEEQYMTDGDISNLYNGIDYQSFNDIITQATQDEKIDQKSTIYNRECSFKKVAIRGDGDCGLYSLIAGYLYLFYKNQKLHKLEYYGEGMFGNINIYEHIHNNGTKTNELEFKNMNFRAFLMDYFSVNETGKEIFKSLSYDTPKTYFGRDITTGTLKYIDNMGLKLLSNYLKVNIETFSTIAKESFIFLPDKEWVDNIRAQNSISLNSSSNEMNETIHNSSKDYNTIFLYQSGGSGGNAHYELLIPYDTSEENMNMLKKPSELEEQSMTQTPSSSGSELNGLPSTIQQQQNRSRHEMNSEVTEGPITPQGLRNSPQSRSSGFSPHKPSDLGGLFTAESQDPYPYQTFMDKVHFVSKDESKDDSKDENLKKYAEFMKKVEIQNQNAAKKLEENKEKDKKSIEFKKFSDFMSRIKFEKHKQNISAFSQFMKKIKIQSANEIPRVEETCKRRKVQGTSKTMNVSGPCVLRIHQQKHIFQMFRNQNIHVSLPEKGKDYERYFQMMHLIEHNIDINDINKYEETKESEKQEKEDMKFKLAEFETNKQSVIDLAINLIKQKAV